MRSVRVVWGIGRISDIGTANLSRAVATVNSKLRLASQLDLWAVESRSECEYSDGQCYLVGGFNICHVDFQHSVRPDF